MPSFSINRPGFQANFSSQSSVTKNGHTVTDADRPGAGAFNAMAQAQAQPSALVAAQSVGVGVGNPGLAGLGESLGHAIASKVLSHVMPMVEHLLANVAPAAHSLAAAPSSAAVPSAPPAPPAIPATSVSSPGTQSVSMSSSPGGSVVRNSDGQVSVAPAGPGGSVAVAGPSGVHAAGLSADGTPM